MHRRDIVLDGEKVARRPDHQTEILGPRLLHAAAL